MISKNKFGNAVTVTVYLLIEAMVLRFKIDIMGCDIHMYIEYKRKGAEIFSSFGGRINPGRNYGVFSALAGVRGKGPKPKGLPKDVGYDAKSDSKLYVVEEESTDLVDECTRDQAEKWVAGGSANYTDESKKFVTHPDWHSYSWATIQELEQAIDNLLYEEPEYRAVLAAMKSFEESGKDTRIVFWFDN